MKNKKAFTVVELVIVIAIIAILAAVLIPTFANIIKKANVSKDQQLIRNLNTALASDRAENGGKAHANMTEALEAAKKFGYEVGKINASGTDNEILWDSKNDVFCYYDADKKTVEYIPSSVSGVDAPAKESTEYWCIITEKNVDKAFATNGNEATLSCGRTDMKWSCYLDKVASGVDTITTSTGVDVGETTEITTINYVNNEAAQSVIVRTNGGTLLVGSSSAVARGTVTHYGTLDSTVIYTENDSFHTHGLILYMDLKAGKVVAEENGIIFLMEACNDTTAFEENGGIIIVPADAIIHATNTDSGIGKCLADLGYTVSPTASENDSATVGIPESKQTAIANALFKNGSGTADDPYTISTAKEFLNIKNMFAKSNGEYVYYILKNDIDLGNLGITGYICELKDKAQKIDLNMNGKSLLNIKNYVFEDVSTIYLYNGVLDFDGNGGLIDDAATNMPVNIKVKDINIEGELTVNTTHYGPIVAYAYGRNTYDSVFTAENVLINATIDNKNTGGYTGGLYGFLGGSKVDVIVRNCTFNGSAQGSAYAGGFCGHCTGNGGIRSITNEGNTVNGSLLASTKATAFGSKSNTTEDLKVTVGSSAAIATVTASTTLYDASTMSYGSEISINHTNTSIAYYTVAVEYWVNRNSDGTGGYPRQLTSLIQVDSTGSYTTGLYKNTFEQVSSVPNGVTFIIDESDYKVWKDGSIYKIYDENYTITNNLSYRYIRVYGYTSNDVMVTYQNYQYPSHD